VQNLRATPYNLAWGSSVYARVSAINYYQTSAYSDQTPETSLAVIITYPSKPLSLVETVPDRTATAVGLAWLEGIDNGGSSVVDYEVSHAILPAAVYTVAKDFNLGLSFLDADLTSGSRYKFRVRSRNEFGYSDYSDEIELLVAFVPMLPVPPVTSVIASDVILTWTAPYNNGSPITKYLITIRQSDNTYTESPYCNGQLEATRASLLCTIPLASLTASPYTLVQGNTVNAKVIAYNFYGPSTESDVGSGAIIVLVPQPPIGLANAPSVTTAYVIGLTWNDDMRTGGAPIIDYRVSYDQSTGIYIVLAQGLTTRSYTTTVPLTPGASYNFKVEARNSVGYSNLSTARSIIAS